jgi:hypothetical protein
MLICQVVPAFGNLICIKAFDSHAPIGVIGCSSDPGRSDMTIVKSVAAMAVLLASPAFAQDKPIEFRLAAAKTNPVGCTSLDAALSRVHTVTRTGDTATIKSAGGVDDVMKQKTPNVYSTVFTLGGVRLDVVADASVTPRTLTVVEAQRGCKWNATAP